MQTKTQKRWAIAGGAAGVCLLLAWVALFGSFSSHKDSVYVLIDSDDTADSVYTKLQAAADPTQMLAMRMLGVATGYGKRVRPGRYGIDPSEGSLKVFRRLRNGQQTPVRLTIPSVRTLPQLAARLSQVIEADSATLAAAFTDDSVCAAYGLDTATMACLFLPNTYEVYWNITPTQLLDRMKRESRAFWTTARKEKAQAAGLTPCEVITLASIVDQETANDAEKPMVAGMYLNRLRQGMKLQADPTVKFALQRFDLRRILHEHLAADSPYNTYRYEGLPPGPICIPSLASIEAVLDYAHHDYIYMCANEDFSGTHRFAVTYAEHMQNARRYAETLNERGIK